MAEDPSFRDLIGRVRGGDAEAAAELVRRYEPAIRLAVRARLANSKMRRLLDSVDICQSVLASFFVRAAAGQYEVDQPEQLLRLFTAMARNKLKRQAERQGAARRGGHHTQQASPEETELADPSPGPSQVVAQRELLEKVLRRLAEEEPQLAALRALDYSWAAIAQEIGGNPDTLRIRYTRAIDRIACELALEE
jgi:RNA polymerase sigma-70 factor (ECF subfamily)